MVVSLSWEASISPRPLNISGVGGLAALRQAIERWHGEVEVALVDEQRHLAVEKGDEQRGDVGAVHVGVGHDDDFVVAQVLLAVGCAGAGPQGLDEVRYLLVSGELVLGGAGDVEDFAA